MRRLRAGFAFIGLALAVACGNNMMFANIAPVPPVHHVPRDITGTVILLDKDPTIETRDPNHVVRANEQAVPQQYRTAMVKALELAGFKVTANAAERHELVAKLAINVTENSETDIRQVYRCGVWSPDGKLVEQIDWPWPKGTYVDPLEFFEFVSHNVGTQVATSRTVLAWLRRSRSNVTPSEETSDAGP